MSTHASAASEHAARPCPQCGGTDRFYLVARPRAGGPPFWHCRMCGFREQQDSNDPVVVEAQQREALTPEQIAQAYHGYAAVANWCAAYLWSKRPDAGEARAYLASRGLSEHTITTARLGFHPFNDLRSLGSDLWQRDQAAYEGARLGGLLCRQGRPFGGLRGSITIPYLHNGTCTLVRMRKLHAEPDAVKYFSPAGPLYAGGTPTLYLADALESVSEVLLCEGEFDALLAWQCWQTEELRLPAVAQPGVGYLPDAFLDMLAGKRVYVAYDREARKDVFCLSPGERFSLVAVEKLRGMRLQAHLEAQEQRVAVLAKKSRARDAQSDEAIAERAAAQEALTAAQHTVDQHTARKIQCRVLRLPRPEQVAKVDMGSFLLAHSAAALQHMVDAAPDAEAWYARHHSAGYRFHQGGIWKGSTWLANYQAIVSANVEQHDGTRSRTAIKIVTQSPAGVRREALIDAADWADTRKALQYVRETTGDATSDDQGPETLRAIKMLSAQGDGPAHQTVYRATGWQLIDDVWHYLMPDGAITAAGVTADTRAAIDPAVPGNHYALCGDGDAAQGATAIGQLMTGAVCPSSLALPLVSQPAYAVLHRWFATSDRALLWIEGKTGSLKTALASAVLSCFGPSFTRRGGGGGRLTKWDTTSTAFELVAYTYRDALFVMDDYKPGIIKPDHLLRAIHNYGESTSRSRGKAERHGIGLQHTYPARGVSICSAEARLPEDDQGQGARVLGLHIQPGDIQDAELRDLQAAGEAGHLAAFFREFVQAIALMLDQPDGIPRLQVLLRALEDRASSELEQYGHRRTQTYLRHIRASWLVFSRWLVQRGTLHESEAQELDAQHLEALSAIANAQQHEQQQADPVDVFLSVLSEGLANQEAVIESESGENRFIKYVPPDDMPDESLRVFQRLAHQFVGREYAHHPDAVGLFPSRAFAFVKERLRQQGRTFSIPARDLWRAFAERGLIVESTPSRYPQYKPGGDQPWVILLRRDAVGLAIPDPDPPDLPESPDDITRITTPSTVSEEHGNAGDGSTISNTAAHYQHYHYYHEEEHIHDAVHASSIHTRHEADDPPSLLTGGNAGNAGNSISHIALESLRSNFHDTRHGGNGHGNGFTHGNGNGHENGHGNGKRHAPPISGDNSCGVDTCTEPLVDTAAYDPLFTPRPGPPRTKGLAHVDGVRDVPRHQDDPIQDALQLQARMTPAGLPSGWHWDTAHPYMLVRQDDGERTSMDSDPERVIQEALRIELGWECARTANAWDLYQSGEPLPTDHAHTSLDRTQSSPASSSVSSPEQDTSIPTDGTGSHPDRRPGYRARDLDWQRHQACEHVAQAIAHRIGRAAPALRNTTIDAFHDTELPALWRQLKAEYEAVLKGLPPEDATEPPLSDACVQLPPGWAWSWVASKGLWQAKHLASEQRTRILPRTEEGMDELLKDMQEIEKILKRNATRR